MSKRTKLILLSLLAAIAVGGAGYSLRTRAAARPDDMTLYGNVDIRDVNLAFRVTGRLAEMAFDEGDGVHAGDIVGKLDTGPIEREVAEAQASVASLKARLLLVRAGYRKEEKSQARAMVAEKQSTLSNAERLLARQRLLSGTGATSQRLYDDAGAARDEAEARLRSAQESLRLLEAGYRPEEIQEASANLQKAEAVLAQARLRLDDAVLRAPADGVILTRAAEPGTILPAGTTVFTLSLVRPVWVRAYVGESNLGRISSGARVSVRTDSRPDRPYSGHVGFVSPTAEFTPKSVETPELRTDLVYRIRVIIDDPDASLKQGMPVTISIGPQALRS